MQHIHFSKYNICCIGYNISKRKGKIYDKPKPVFATFVKDTPEILAQCMNADKKLLRMEKFMDENDDVTIVDKHVSNNY